MAVTAKRSAAVEFASINELLLMLAEHVYDCSSLRALCLSSHKLYEIFSNKLGERVVVRIKDNDDQDAAERIINECLIPGPYLPDLPHLQLEVNNGPDFPERTLNMIEKLISHVPNLKKFTWISEHGDVPIATLATLGRSCRHLEELHLNCGAELVKQQSNGFPEMHQRPSFERVHTLTCRRVGIWRALHILHECPSIEKVEMVQMKQMQQSGWLHTGYHAHLKAMVSFEENNRRHNKKPLKMNMCYSRGPNREGDEREPVAKKCPVCESPGMQYFDHYDPRFQSLWQSWAAGRARQFFSEQGEVRHLTYEYPHPDKKDEQQQRRY